MAPGHLFATHYHQLIGLEGEIDSLFNIHVQVAEIDQELTFLHTVSEGPCDDSYGVQVASLAGLPTSVIERARDLLIFLNNKRKGLEQVEKVFHFQDQMVNLLYLDGWSTNSQVNHQTSGSS